MHMPQKRMISYICFSPMRPNSRPIFSRLSRSLCRPQGLMRFCANGLSRVGSGGVTLISGRMKRHCRHDLRRVVVVGLRIVMGMAAQGFPRAVVIAVGDDSLAVRIGKRRWSRRAMTCSPCRGRSRKRMISGPQQAADIGAGGIGEAGIDLLGHRRTADLVVALEHQDLELVAAALLAAHGEIGRAGQPVMAAADDDAVVGWLHGPESRWRLPLAPDRAAPRWRAGPDSSIILNERSFCATQGTGKTT